MFRNDAAMLIIPGHQVRTYAMTHIRIEIEDLKVDSEHLEEDIEEVIGQ